MIRYALKCEKGHVFDSWFQSADAFDALVASGHLSCAVCGSAEVGKSMMAPRVSSGEVSEPETPLAEPASDAEKMLAQMRHLAPCNMSL